MQRAETHQSPKEKLGLRSRNRLPKDSQSTPCARRRRIADRASSDTFETAARGLEVLCGSSSLESRVVKTYSIQHVRFALSPIRSAVASIQERRASDAPK